MLSPGIDLKYDSIPGYSAAAQTRMPHAWKSGTQVKVLRDQVMNMKKGGTFVMLPPPNPYRCPPGPYERVSMIAHMLKETNPTAKIIVLDPKPKFSKQGLFMAGWEKHYPGMIEWIGPDTHGGILNVNADTMEIETDLDTFQADAACVVPAQRAGSIAMAAGVNDGDWCPIVPATMASRADENIYVLGDASVASAMPKSGFSANSQAKVAANAIRGELTGSRVYDARFANTCWSLVATNDGVRLAPTTRLAMRRSKLSTSSSHRAMSPLISARQLTKNQSAGTKVSPPICSHKQNNNLNNEGRPEGRLSYAKIKGDDQHMLTPYRQP